MAPITLIITIFLLFLSSSEKWYLERAGNVTLQEIVLKAETSRKLASRAAGSRWFRASPGKARGYSNCW